MKRHIFLTLVVFSALTSAVLAVDPPVYFADPNLKAAVETALGKTDPTPTDMLGLNSLGTGWKGIFDLTGLEYATNLNNLNLPSNQISDLSPLASLTGLYELYLSDNEISDLSPLAGLTSLDGLYLGQNQISDLSPLAGLTSLDGLYLGQNQISDLSPLAGLTSLTDLGLGENQISNLSPLAGLTSLDVLVLGQNQISDLSPLAGLTGLTGLYLYDNQISNLSSLAGLTGLMTLSLSDNQISDLSPLAGLTGLMTLHLSDNQISNLLPLAGLTNLLFLNLNSNQISGISVFSTMFMVPPVGSLSLKENPLNTEALTVHIPAFKTHNPTWLVFYDPPKKLTLSSGAGGTVTDPGIGSFLYTQYVQVSITAVPYTSYHFVEWSGTAVDAAHVADPNAASTTVDMYDDYTLHANFAIDQHTLTISSTAGGSVTTPGEGPYQYDKYNGCNSVPVTATADTNYHFTGWTGTAVDAGKVANPSSANTTVTVDSDYTLVANFAIDQHTLTISSTTGGSVTTPGEGPYQYDHGSSVPVTATAQAHYHFTGWTGIAVNAGKVTNPSSANTTVTMDADYTLQANFAIDQHTLTISSTAGGSVITPGEGPYQYDHGSSVPVTATADTNYHFTGWTGTAVDAGKVDNPSSASTTVTVGADYTLVANFAIDQHTLTISSTAGGSVITPGEGPYQYDHGSSVPVTATADTNYHFVNWTGTAVDAGKVANPSSANTTVTVNADYTLVANFAIDQHTLTISSTADGSVTTPGEGSYQYDHGSSVPVTATADTNYHFTGWTGTAVDAGMVDDPSLASTNVTVDSDYTLVANFAIDQHTLTPSSTAGGSVILPGEIPYRYNHGTGVWIFARAEANYHFVNWTGTAVDADKVVDPSSASTTVAIDADYTLVANFAINQFTLTVSSTSGGSVSTPGEGSFQYDHDSEVLIEATPEANYHFVNWTGTAVDADKVVDPNSASTTVAIDADYTLRAVFMARRMIIYVDTNATGANDGSSWLNAYNYLQDALADANSVKKPIEIRVGQGIYKPDKYTLHPEIAGDRQATFRLINGVTIRGGYAGFGEADPNARDIELYETILSADLDDEDALVTNPGNLLDNIPNAHNSYHVVIGSRTNQTAVLDGFTIVGGNANGSDINNEGGGMYNDSGSPIVMSCIFVGNSAEYGGGLANSSDSNPTLINCIFFNNSAGKMGGGVYEGSGSGSTLVNCLVSNNYAPYGGGMYSSNSNTTLTNCTFAWNLAKSGGGINIISGNIIATNCIFWGNSDADGRDESAQIYIDGGVVPAVDFCCIEGWTSTLGGVGNIGDDPMFIDADGPDNIVGTEDDDLRLSAGSPCVDAGDNTVVPLDTSDLDGDGDVSERIPFDLDGNLRFVDDPFSDNCGFADPPEYLEIVDMGAYEYAP